jgi:hypothetical protein
MSEIKCEYKGVCPIHGERNECYTRPELCRFYTSRQEQENAVKKGQLEHNLTHLN